MNDYSMFIGLDLSDRKANYCVLDEGGEVQSEGQLRLDRKSLRQFFSGLEPCAVALETGTHSRWVSEVLWDLNHFPVVANARKLRSIYANEYKSDRRDAEHLARLLRSDPKLLYPIAHRGRQAQADLAVLKTRDHFVRERTKAINHVRGIVKSFGYRLQTCSTACFHRRALDDMPADLHPALQTMLDHIESLNQRIRELNGTIKKLAKERYPETERLMTVPGVGVLTAMAFVLTIEEPQRFAQSRSVGPFLGLVPGRDQSGNRDLHLPITKCGDGYARRLLVSSAQYILGPFAPPSALRDWGMQHAQHHGRGAKRVAVIGVARRLSVMLHRLWIEDTDFVPYPQKRKYRTPEAAAT